VKETSAPGVSPDEAREQLQRILGSPLFSSARRQSEFLQFVVRRAIEGHAGDIKESLIGVEVYGRNPSYDPKADSIVRAEASRLRAKLREYYDTEGRHDPLRIELPKGTYTPAFRLTGGEAVTEPPSPPQVPVPGPKAKFHWWWAAAASAALIAVAVALLWWPAGGRRHSRSIAVMPVRNLGPDRAGDSIGDMLADEFTSALIDSADWKVVGRAAPGDQSGRDPMLSWSQQNLHADFVLTGSYRVGENSGVTLSLQLADVQDAHLLWTRTYQRRLALLSESQFARSVVAELTAKMSRTSSGRAARIPANEQARQSYAGARELLDTGDDQDLQQSLKLFQRTIDADPTFEPAWAGLGEANILLKDGLAQPVEKRTADARAAAVKAIALDESDGEAHSVLGRALEEEWKFGTAALELARAAELDPIRIFTHIHYSMALTVLGDFAGAQAAVEVARARLPPIPEVLFQQGSVFFLGRRPEKLEQLGRQLIALEPNGALGHWLVGLALEERGETQPAIGEFKRGLTQNPRDLRTLCALSHAYGLAGNKAQAFETAGRYIDLHTNTITRTTLSYCAALLYTGMGRKDEAFEWLENARSGHDPSFPFFLYDWRFDPLKRDPRYEALAVWQRDRMRQ
jgi:TolB-like protein